MKSSTLNKEMIRKKLALIIQEIGNIEIVDDETSLFSFQYNLSAESLVYILLRAGNEFGFKINDEFIASLEDYSFHNILSSVTNQVVANVTHSNN